MKSSRDNKKIVSIPGTGQRPVYLTPKELEEFQRVLRDPNTLEIEKGQYTYIINGDTQYSFCNRKKGSSGYSSRLFVERSHWDFWSYNESDTPVLSSEASQLVPSIQEKKYRLFAIGEADEALSDGDEFTSHESKSFSCS